MVQSINNAGSQQALESNWNDENAMRKFERATDGAARQRKHEILDNKQRLDSVELRASSTPLDQQPVPIQPETPVSSFDVKAAGRQQGHAPAGILVQEQPAPAAGPRFIAAGIALAVIAIISIALYFA